MHSTNSSSPIRATTFTKMPFYIMLFCRMPLKTAQISKVTFGKMDRHCLCTVLLMSILVSGIMLNVLWLGVIVISHFIECNQFNVILW